MEGITHTMCQCTRMGKEGGREGGRKGGREGQRNEERKEGKNGDEFVILRLPRPTFQNLLHDHVNYTYTCTVHNYAQLYLSSCA